VRRSRTLTRVLVASLIIALLYVPSVGPVVFVQGYFDFGTDSNYAYAVEAIYGPVLRYAFQNRESHLYRYIMWWAKRGTKLRDPLG
jgi:hypothetical protein